MMDFSEVVGLLAGASLKIVLILDNLSSRDSSGLQKPEVFFIKERWD
jgi:hypothetical protein